MIMGSDIIQYKSFVSELAKKKTNRVFINSDKEHAVIVFVELFNNARETVRIFAGCLSDPIGNDPNYIEALSNFIDKTGKVRILLNDYKEDEVRRSNLFKRLAYYISVGMDIQVKSTDKRAYFTNDPEKRGVHFTVADEDGYRIETDTINRTAECNFNNRDISKKLVDTFDEVFMGKEGTSSLIDLNMLFSYGN